MKPHIKQAVSFLFLAVLLNLCAICLAAEKAEKEAVSFPKKIFNFHIIEPGLMRGSQPNESGLRLLKDYCGLKTVLDLREDEMNIGWERGIVEGLGMVFVSIPMSGSRLEKPETIEKCVDILHDKTRQPVFVHCYAGKDRTGLICAAYRMKYQQWSMENALLEMLMYGYSRGCCLEMEKSLSAWDSWRKEAAAAK